MGKRIKIALICLHAFLFACSDKVKNKEIAYEGFIVKGNIIISGKDTTFEGPIEYYDSSGKLSTLINFSKNKRDGQYVDYHSNGQVSQTAYYSQGELHGFVTLFDTLGKPFYKANYFHGIEMGDNIKFSIDTFKTYTFKSFEGLELYKCGWSFENKIVERGGFLNYVTNYCIEPDDINKLRLSVFIYLINPPHKKLTYNLYDKNIKTGDSSLMYTASGKNNCFETFFIDTLQEGHKYLWDVQAFYPTEKVNLSNILKESDRELILPGLSSE